jgi:exodeoxyribonuclease VII large subunit
VPLTSSPERPLPLRTISRAITEWVDRLGRVWVEGQVAQLTRRPGMAVTFLTLRDTAADVSMSVTVARGVLEAMAAPLVEGAQVVCWVKPEVRPQRGSLQLTALEIRPVGLGALLARLEALKKVLAGEGLFAADRKQPLPFLPRQVGLITGRASAAERDVVETARRRWPGVQFATREVAVQGPGAVSAVIAALRELAAVPDVDVIVLTRGGGSVEDLLPFSDEVLCRAVAACRTPVISAIGHEQDTPLVDYVADCRCSTPTDAGKRVVPDVAEERTRISRDRAVLQRAAAARVQHERQQVDALRQRARRRVAARADAGRAEIGHLRARVRALSPLATLERGYAVVLRAGQVVRSITQIGDDDQLLIRLADGTRNAIALPSGTKPKEA